MPQSTTRAFDILEALGSSNRGLKHGEIAQALHIPKSSLTKIIRDLVLKGYVQLDNLSKTYTIGPQILVLARAH